MWIYTGLIALSTLGIGLAWCLPMCLNVQKKLKQGLPVGLAMKICMILFVSIPSGILLAVRDNY